MSPPRRHADTSRKPWIAAAVVLGLLALGVAVGVAAGRDGLAVFARHAAAMQLYALHHPVLAMAAYVAAFAGSLLTFIPVCLLLTALGGFLFGAIPAAAASVAGALLAALAGYAIGRSTFEGMLERRLGARAEVIAKLARGLRRDALSYVLCLRLIPFAPFTLVSLAAGSVEARMSRFLAATAVGIAPECLIYAFAGHGLGAVMSRGGDLSLHGLVRPELIWPLTGVAALYLVALVLRGVLARRDEADTPPAHA